MTKFVNFLTKLEKKLSLNFSNGKFLNNFFMRKKINKIKRRYFNQREICTFCNRYTIEKYKQPKMIHIDNHLPEHNMLTDLPTYIPVRTYHCTIDLESIVININMQKNFQIWENFFFFFAKKLLVFNASTYYINKVRKTREYVFLNYRLSNIFIKTRKLKKNWKNILHGWNDIRSSKNTLVPQRGEVVTGISELRNELKRRSKGKTIFREFFQQSIYFFRFLNKKKYEWDLTKRLNNHIICLFPSKLKNLMVKKEIESLRFFNFYQHISKIFFLKNPKLSTIDFSISIRNKFLSNFRGFIKAKNNYLLLFIRTCFKINN